MTAEAVPVRPGFTFEGVVRLTRTGTVYLLFTIVIGFAALNTGNNPLYIGLTFMLGCLLLSGIASKSGLRHLEVEITNLDEVWAGRTTAAQLRVVNRSRLWNVRDVIIVSPSLSEPAFVPVVPRKAAVEVTATFLFLKRGRVSLNHVDLYTRYPFGFFLKKRRVRIGGEVLVLPRLVDDASVREKFRPHLGEESTSNRPGHGTDVHSFREFAHGDSLRQVYWKKSASFGRWIVKQTELESARSVHVYVDLYKPRTASEDDFETMISAAATFIDEAVSHGADVLLLLPKSSISVRQGKSAMPLFRALAQVEAEPVPEARMVDRDTMVFGLARNDEPQGT